jgi:hypothetical protein
MLFLGAEFEGQVERAEAQGGGGGENDGQDKQDDAECASDDAAKVGIGEDGCNEDADNAVNISNVLFHESFLQKGVEIFYAMRRYFV